MPNTFTNSLVANVGTTPVTTYSAPASTTSIMIGVNLSNTTASQVKVDVQLNSIYLIKGVPIPANSALSPLDGKIVMKAGQVLTVTSDTASSSDVAVSVLEIS